MAEAIENKLPTKLKLKLSLAIESIENTRFDCKRVFQVLYCHSFIFLFGLYCRLGYANVQNKDRIRD